MYENMVKKKASVPFTHESYSYRGKLGNKTLCQPNTSLVMRYANILGGLLYAFIFYTIIKSFQSVLIAAK